MEGRLPDNEAYHNPCQERRSGTPCLCDKHQGLFGNPLSSEEANWLDEFCIWDVRAAKRGERYFLRRTIKSEILSAIRAPDSKGIERTATEGIGYVLLGAASAGFQCAHLFDEYHTWLKKNPKIPRDCPLSSVQSTFEDSLLKDAFPNWGATPEMLVWSIGFFMNRMFHNIAAAIDRCTNAWLTYAFRLDASDPTSEDVWSSTWPTSRLYLLMRRLREHDPHLQQEPTLIVENLRRAFLGTLANTEEANGWLITRTKEIGGLQDSLLLMYDKALDDEFMRAPLHDDYQKPRQLQASDTSRGAHCTVFTIARVMIPRQSRGPCNL